MSRVQPGMSEHRGLADRIKSLEAQVARLSRARTMQSTSLDGGTFRVKGGGTIEILDGSGNVIHTFDIDGMTVFEADGSTLMQLDGTGIVLNDGSGNKLIDLTTAGLKAYELDGSTLAVIDGTGIRLNDGSGTKLIDLTTSGLKAYEADGSTLMVLDGSRLRFNDGSGAKLIELTTAGLEVIGGMVTPLWINDQSDFTENTTLDSTHATQNSITFNPPSWVQTLFVEISLFGQCSDGSIKNFATRVVGDTTADGGFEFSLDGNTQAAARRLARSYTFFPVTIEQEARVSSGTNSANRLDLVGRAVGVRDP